MDTERSKRSQRSDALLEASKSPGDVLQMIVNAHKSPRFNPESLIESACDHLVRDPEMTEAEWRLAKREELYRQLEWIANKINKVAERRRAGPMQPSKSEKLRATGQKAVNDLKRALSQYTNHLLSELEQEPNPLLTFTAEAKADWQASRMSTIQDYLKMGKSLRDFEPSDLRSRQSHYRQAANSWHTDAARFFIMFRDIVGKASTSRNGPAVRFVEMALEYVGVPLSKRKLGNIEQALRRSGLNKDHKL